MNRTKCGLLTRGAERELVQVCFSDDHRAGFAQALHRNRIPFRHVTRADFGRCGCRLSSDVDEILDRDRHSVERTAIDAAPSFVVDHLCRGARAGLVDENECVRPLAVLGDCGEALLQEARGGDRWRGHASKTTVAWPRRQACGDVP